MANNNESFDHINSQEIQDCPTVNSFIKCMPFRDNIDLFCMHIRSMIKKFNKLLLVIDSSSVPIDVIVINN